MEIWILFFKKKEHVYNRNDALQDLKNVGREGSPWVETEGRQDDRSPQKLHDSPAFARLLSRPLHMFELREDIVGTSPVVQGRRHHIPNTGSRGSIPDGGTKIPYASRCGRKKKRHFLERKQYYRTVDLEGTSGVLQSHGLTVWVRRDVISTAAHR